MVFAAAQRLRVRRDRARLFTFAYLQAFPGGVGNVLSNDLLLAVPFTFMGSTGTLRSGRGHADWMGQLFGPIRGGLGYSVIIVGFILGAITGTVAAQVIAALISCR